jgi:hypothetical protein
MKKGKITATAILLTLMCILSACNKAEPIAAVSATAAATTTIAATTTAATAATTAKATTSGTAAEEITGESVYPEVTMQSYTDTEMLEVIELGTDNEEFSTAMTEMNADIKKNVLDEIERYEELLSDSNFNTDYYVGGINVWAYSISDENYIQIYNTVFEYPTYGTAGELFGFVYDIAEDDYVTLDEFMERIGTTADDLTYEITEIYAASKPTDTVGGVYIKTFNLMKGPDGEYSYGFMFEMEVTPEGGDVPYKGFYMYTPFDGDVWEMNSEQLFDPYSVDQYDPPLHCQEDVTDGQGDIIPASDTFGILQGEYKRDGEDGRAYFVFYGTENVDSYYASGSYEMSYTLSARPDVEIKDDSGDTYNEVSFEMYDSDGNLSYIIKMLDAAPGSFELYDSDEKFFGEYISTNI